MNGCRKRAIERPLVVLALLFVAPGCVLETRPVSLETASPPSATTATTGSPLVAVGSFADDRGESSRWIGSIRGPLGNPLYTLEGTAPVSQLVAAAFARGLQERGLLADPAGGVYLLSGRIEELGGNRYVRSEARARIRVMVTERQTGRELFANTYTAVNEKPGALAVGGDATSGIEELRGLVADTLHQVAAQALDDPNLRTALRAAP